MKIRKKIIGISSVAVLAATLLVSGIIWKILGKSQEEEAVMQAYQSCYFFMNDFEEALEKSGTDAIGLEYFFKMSEYADNERQENYNLCFRLGKEVEEIYNPTIFTLKNLLRYSYETYQDNGNISYTRIDRGEKTYLVFQREFQPQFLVFQITDITYVTEYKEQLAIILGVLSLGVVLLTVSILWASVRHMLLPLQKLNDSAKKIAEGVYDDRVDIKGKDEIGELGKSFNQMAQAVETKTQHLEESERRKTLFMGNLTHELKTPMTAISGYAQTLLTTKLELEEQEEALLYIYEQCGRLERLSKKMMRLLEVDGEEALHYTNVSAKQLFEDAKKSCKILLEKKSMVLECVSHDEMYRVDYDLMLDVLINLIDNGVKASEEGSRIRLIASEDSITVQDFGRGIPEEEKERILEPFYMIDKSRSRKCGGAGLGLSLAALIIKRHNMKMEIESEIGKGTSIHLQFAYKMMNT